MSASTASKPIFVSRTPAIMSNSGGPPPRGLVSGTARLAGGLLARSASSLNRVVVRPAMSLASKPLAFAAKPLAAAARYTVEILNDIATDVATAGVVDTPPAAASAPRQLMPSASIGNTHKPARSACETPEPSGRAHRDAATGSNEGSLGQLEAMATGRLEELPVDSHAWALTAEQARAGSAVWRAAHATSQRIYAQRAARAAGHRVALPAMSSPEIERQRVAVLRRATAASRTCSCAESASRCDASTVGACAECDFSDSEAGDDRDGDAGADCGAAASPAGHSHAVASYSDGSSAGAAAACYDNAGDVDVDAVDAAAMRALAMFRQVKRLSSGRGGVTAAAAGGAGASEARAAAPLSPLAERDHDVDDGDAEAEGADLASSYCSVAGRGEGKEGCTPAPLLRQHSSCQLSFADCESLAPSPRMMMLQPATPAPLTARPAPMDAQRTPAACTRMSLADFVGAE